VTTIALILSLLLLGASERETRWLFRQAWIESRGNPDAVSYRGERYGCGLLQASSIAAEHLGIDDSCENRKRILVNAYIGLNVLRHCVKVHGWKKARTCYSHGANHDKVKEK